MHTGVHEMTRRHKVMWLIKGLGLGGAERLLTVGIPHLDRSTYDYEVSYLLPWKTDVVPDFERVGIPVHCLQLNKVYDMRVIRRIARLLHERQVDLLHVHSPHAAVLARIAARLSGTSPIVYTEHNLVHAYHPVTRIFHRLTSVLDDVTIAVSNQVLESIMKSKWFRPAKASVIYGGIQVEHATRSPAAITQARRALGIPDGYSVIGNVAHIRRPEKGHPYLIEAAKLIMDSKPNTILICVGREKEAGYVASLKRQAAVLGIEDRVLFTGFVQDAMTLVPAFDVFVLSSLFEGLPVAMMEAMSLGIPPVVTDVGGIPEVVTDGHNGYLVKPRDSVALANRVITILEDTALRTAFGQRARATALERFSAKRMVREIEAIYATALTGS